MDLANCILPSMDKREDFQAHNLILNLLAMNWKCLAFGLHIKIGVPI